VIVCLSIRRIHFEADEQRLQDQVYEDFKINYTRTPIFSFQSNEASVLEYITPIYFLVYSVVVVLHAHVIESAPMIGLTRLVYPSLKPRVIG
jgi:maltodextrin utilization protein YvdJ